jgi:hypothetical protein
VCNRIDDEITHISIKDSPISKDTIEKFRAKYQYLDKENRWAIDFEYGGVSNHFVFYFTKEQSLCF